MGKTFAKVATKAKTTVDSGLLDCEKWKLWITVTTAMHLTNGGVAGVESDETDSDLEHMDDAEGHTGGSVNLVRARYAKKGTVYYSNL